MKLREEIRTTDSFAVLLFHLTSTSSCREVRQNQGKQVRVKVVRNWTEEHPASAEVVTVKLVSYLDALVEKKIV